MRVWAPDAARVELVVGGERHPLAPRDWGWWERERPVEPGVDYAYSIDGGPALPDPRAARLPHGVHGPGQVVDHAAFEWHDDDARPLPLGEGVVYELHVGTFSPAGTFDGAIERLDHLVGLGITHVELMPVHAFPGTHGWGYDVAGFYAVHEPYGGPDGLKRFVDAAHGRGLAVVLDVVYNHLGPEGCYLGSFGPYVTDRFRTPWGGAVNLGEAGSDVVRTFIIENALMWLRDYHLDGLRIDAVHAFVDLTATHLLEELASATDRLARELGRELVLVAESDQNDPRLLRDVSNGGYGLDAQWNDDFHHGVHTTLTGEQDGYYEDYEPFTDLVRVLRRGWAFEGRYSPFRGRTHGRDASEVALERLVVATQNHDQVGNRMRGERLGHLVETDALRVAATLLLAGPFTPMLFQGEEWGAGTPFLFFTDYGDEDLNEAVRRGRREEFAAFGWPPDEVPDPSARETFEASRLDWAELADGPHAELLAWHRELIRLRRSWPIRRDAARPEVIADASERWLTMAWCGRLVVVNLATEERRVPLPAGEWQVVAASEAAISPDAETLHMPRCSAAVLLPPAGTAEG